MRVLAQFETADIAGLRRLLKRLGRSYQVRCIALQRAECPDTSDNVSVAPSVAVIPYAVARVLNRALQTVQRARADQRRRRSTRDGLDAAEAALLEVLGVLHGQDPQRSREAAALAVQSAHARVDLELS